MRILSIGNFGTGWDNSICDEEHIAKALEWQGHYVNRIQRDNLPTVNKNIISKIYDFVLIAQWEGYPEGFIEDMQSLSSTLVYWAFDYQADGQEWHERLIKGSDLYLSKRIADSKYPNWQWLSQDFAPSFLEKPWGENIEKDIDVLFTGSYLPWATERNETLEAVGKKFNLVIHSVNQWPQGNEGPVMDEGLPELYARAKVIISIDHTLERGYWSDRTAQIMACGGLPLVRYIPMMETHFPAGRVVYFYNIRDCLEKIEAFLHRDNTDIEIAACHYAQANLMVKHRVADLLTIVESIL